MICAAITEETPIEAVKTANKVDADLVEIRLDYIPALVDLRWLSEIEKPKIATCMPAWEGGRFQGTEEERMKILESAIPFSEYISIELRTEKTSRDAVISKAREKGVKIILSYHDHEKTPEKEEMEKTIQEEMGAGADIAKVAYNALSHRDAATVLAILAENKAKTPLIAISMGDAGRITRLLSPLLGGYMTFASVSKEKESANGQITIEELRRMQKTLGI